MTSEGHSIGRVGMSSLGSAGFGLSLGNTSGNMWEEALPRLTQETELQKILADEKMRSEQHKTNYQTLKVEHTRLQDEFLSLQQELKSTIEESKLVQDKYKGLLEQARKDYAQKHKEIEDLRVQVLSEEKLELIHMQVREELELPYRAKMQKLNEEAESYRSEYNKVKYEYSFLKSEYEHEKQQQQTVVDELKLRHETEVVNLRKEREMLLARQQADASQSDTQRLRIVQRENAQLNLKVKGLLSELEEIRAQREHQGLQSDHVSRMQSKQLAEHAASVKALQTERDSLRLQCDNIQRELTTATELHTQLTARVHELEKENIIFKNRSEEVTHKSKVEITNLKMDMLRERGDLERERDRLKNDLEDLRSQVEINQHQIDQQAVNLVEKEREAVKRVQAAREEEWQKIHKIENEKLELETKIQELERLKIDEETRRAAEKERMDDKIASASEAKETAEKETLVMKTKLQHQQNLQEQLDRERTENSELKVKVHRLETEFNSYVSNENELLELNSRLTADLKRVNDEVRHCRENVIRANDGKERALAELRASWAEEKLNLQRRVDELEDQLSQTQIKVAQMSNEQRKKKKKYLRVATRLKDRVALLQARLEEAQIERDTLKKSVAPDVHNRIKKQLNDIIRRHREFRAVLASADMSHVPIGELSFASGVIPIDRSGNWTFHENDHHQKDLELLKERLDLLDDNQKAQLDEFRDFQRSSTPTKGRRDAERPLEEILSNDSDEELVKDLGERETDQEPILA